LIRCQLEWLKKPKHTTGQAERLAELEEEERREHGTYLTDVQRWTCSCPAYLVSRFLLCKHLVRAVNSSLLEDPCTNLRFFLSLRRQHYLPYYRIPGIHEMPLGDNESETSDPSFWHANSVAQHVGFESGEGEHFRSDGHIINERQEPDKQAHAFGLEADRVSLLDRSPSSSSSIAHVTTRSGTPTHEEHS
jgi:hypothetical protein